MRFFDLLTGLDVIARQSDGWDGHDARALTDAARACATKLLFTLVLQVHQPDRAVPDVTGGMAFYWFGAERTKGGAHRLAASLKVDPDGDLFVSLVDRVTERVDVTETRLADLESAYARIYAFVYPTEARAAS